MRVCMLAYTFYENDNRVRRYAETLASRGDVVDVVALSRPGQAFHEELHGVDVYRIQERVYDETGRLSYLARVFRFLLNSALFVGKKQRKAPYDLVHAHSVPDFEVFAALLPKLQGARVILDIHDIVPEFYASKFNSGKTSLLFKGLLLAEKISTAFAHHVIVANDIWRERLIERGVAGSRCTTIMNYPDPRIFYRRPRTRDDGRFVIVYPGSLNRHQGVDVAIRAFARIRDQVPEAEFHIYGEGGELHSLIRLASELGLSRRVSFAGRVSMERIADVITNADLGVVPKRAASFGNEASSTKILEFMALGVPVIVSDTMVDRHYYNDSIVRFCESENEDALARGILQLRREPQLRRLLVENASEYIQKNNWEVRKHQYLQLVDRMRWNGDRSAALRARDN